LACPRRFLVNFRRAWSCDKSRSTWSKALKISRLQAREYKVIVEAADFHYLRPEITDVKHGTERQQLRFGVSSFYYVAAELVEVQLRKDRSSATGVTKQGRTHSGQDPNVEVGALA